VSNVEGGFDSCTQGEVDAIVVAVKFVREIGGTPTDAREILTNAQGRAETFGRLMNTTDVEATIAALWLDGEVT
jgi:hypothetical protein